MSVVLADDLCIQGPDGGKRIAEGHLKASLLVSDLPRLAGAIEGGGEVDVDLQVKRSATGVPLVSGQVKAELARHCQRCLDAVRQVLEIELRVAVLAPGTQPQLPQGYEVCEAVSLTLGELLEDEVLLALPMIAMHDDKKQCGSLAGRVEKLECESESESTRHPFAILKDLKTN